MAVVEEALPRTARLDVEDVLRAGGFTNFHRRAVALTGFAWTFVAMEILLVGFTVPLFTAIWGLSGSYAGWIAASALGGSLLGSLVLGPAADRVGRRRIFQAAILWYAVFTALTAFAWGPGSLSAFRFLAGIGLGGMLVVDPAMLAEYLPPQKRGRFLVVLDLFWPVGLLLATGLSWFFLEQVGGDWAWRWLFLAASFPARNSDLWLHLANGRNLVEGNYTPGADPYTFSGADRAWAATRLPPRRAHRGAA